MLESLQQFHFLRPWWFLALLPAAWLVWQLTRSQAQGDHWTRLIAPHLLPFLLDGKGGEEKNRVGWLLLPLAITVLALAGPTWQKLPNPVEKNTSALVVLWDMSPSMLAQDIRPSRLERSRLKLIDLLKTRKDGLTALIAFSGEAYVVTPLTEDVQTIINLLPSLAPTSLPSVGSNPEMALSEAKKLLKAGNLDHGDILFLTDGIDPKAFADLDDQLSGGKDRVTVWGVGTEDGAPIPLPRGGFLQTGKDLVIAKLNSGELKRFAEAHQGYYLPAQADDGDIKFLAQLLARTDQTQVQSDKTFDQWTESGQYLSLLLLPLCLWLFRRGSLLVIVFALSLAHPEPAAAAPAAAEPEAAKPATAPEPAWRKDLRNSWNGLWFTPDQQGARLLKKGDAPAAAEHFANPSWQATAQYQAGDFAAAAKTFSQDKSATGLYNQGTALLKKGDYDGAIKAFDEALKLQPNYSPAQHNKDIALKLKALKAKQPKQNNGQKDPNQKQNGDKNQQQQGDSQNNDSQNGDGQEGDKQSADEEPKSQDQADKSSQDKQNGADGESKEPPEKQDQQAQKDQQEGQNQAEPAAAQQDDKAKQAAEEKAAAQQKAQEEYAKKLAEAAKDQDDGSRAHEAGAAAAESKEQQEDQQKIDQALRRVPDDPGGLLRNKFQYQYKERRMNPQAPKDTNNNPENRW